MTLKYMIIKEKLYFDNREYINDCPIVCKFVYEFTRKHIYDIKIYDNKKKNYTLTTESIIHYS